MRIWPWKRVPQASPKRLSELESDLSDVQMQLAWCKKAIVDLNARMATIARKERASQAAPGATNGEEPLPQEPPRIYENEQLTRAPRIRRNY